MIYQTVTAFGNTLSILCYAIITTLIINIVFVKDFRILLNKIKKVAFSRQTNKATKIQNLLYNYFFVD